MAEKYLDKVYQTTGKDAQRDLYDAWSTTYDDEVGEHGYLTPRRVADAMGRCISDKTTPILDYGCGTGLGGTALRDAGFKTCDGADPAAEMLAVAQEKKMYRTLTTLDLSRPLPFTQGQYAAIVAIGVISTGAGPASLMDTLIDLLPTGGYLGFSLNDHALADESYTARVKALEAADHRKLVEDYGEHLPGLDLKSMVYVFEKA
ncbi:class I SAM-dependent DNA methyltransferase [Litoreibacter roseus]|uniref:SAM-dependent methyltransferase n=1 Tax=Litoreibacter roseus TaxID=2601869 RepID=A0A6N6JJY5_9RHOB|nr:methyltransferase domain-containing protein [Litoreibacter roseus]GFE66633.1 SAM-dependent methyltransferase [Litoreibacter roseus]